jgi:hypothetical protein
MYKEIFLENINKLKENINELKDVYYKATEAYYVIKELKNLSEDEKEKLSIDIKKEIKLWSSIDKLIQKSELGKVL